MANTIRIKRSTGSVGPVSLANSELAFAEGSGALYIGVGTGGAGGTATTIPQIGGTAPFASTAPNRVWASPGSGATAAQATFRALVAADLPSHAHVISDITDLATELADRGNLNGGNSWADQQDFSDGVTFYGNVSLGNLATATTPAAASNGTAVATTAFVKSLGYTSNAGTVTSVTLSLPNIFSVSPATVTSSGTLTASFVSQAAKSFLASPNAAAGLPSFRLIAASDLPTHSHSIGDVTGLTAALADAAYLGGDNYFSGTLNTFASPVDLGSQATASTQVSTDSSTKVATTAFVKNQGYLAAAGGTVTGDLTVSGTLTVNGGTTTINSTTVSVDDKNIELGSTATPTDATADGGGITLKGTTDKTLNWVDSTDSWTSNQHFNLLTGYSYKINGSQVLSATALGSGVTSSSLTSVGTITSGTWSATAIAVAKGGTGATDAATARTNLGIGSIATQAANNVAITGGSIDGITIDGGTW